MFGLSNLSSLFGNLTNTTKILLLVVALYVVYNVLVRQGIVKNTGIFTSSVDSEWPTPDSYDSVPVSSTGSSEDIYKNNPNVLPHPQMSNEYAGHPMNDVQPHELLPREGGFQDSNPQGQGSLNARNFFESGHHHGLNSTGSTKKNANLQLRSDPPIIRQDVGPWHNSTIESDNNRRQFDIGGI